MKRCIASLLLMVSVCAHAERFVINERNGTTVDVARQGDMMQVDCRFPAKNKFDQAINAQLNDQKGDQLFFEGLIRYFKAGPSGTIECSGKRVLGVRVDGEYLVYSFAVPKDGCRVVSRPATITCVTNQTMSAQCSAMMNKALALLSNTNGVSKTNNGGKTK